jgi:cytochrome c2
VILSITNGRAGQGYTRFMRCFATLFAALALGTATAYAAGDPAAGRKLVEEKKCEACHHNKTLGDAKAVYLRKDRKVTSREKLAAQVARCNSELNLQLFPDEEEHIVAFLNDTYYKFK